MTVRATGNAIVKALILIELVKRRQGDLHQLNKIYSIEIVTMEKSQIEGIPDMENRRRVTAMDTILSKDELSTEDPGYQKPEPKEEVTRTVSTTNKERKQRKPKKKFNNFDKEGNKLEDEKEGGENKKPK